MFEYKTETNNFKHSNLICTSNKCPRLFQRFHTDIDKYR